MSTNPSDRDLSDALSVALTDTIGHNLDAPDPNLGAELATEALVESLQARLQNTTLQHASEANAWRTREADLITREINARKAWQDLAAKLEAVERRAAALELEATRPPTLPVIPANAPRKRRRPSIATVSDVPTRITRAVQRRLTLEALEAEAAAAAAAAPSLLNQPTLVAEPELMEEDAQRIQPSMETAPEVTNAEPLAPAGAAVPLPMPQTRQRQRAEREARARPAATTPARVIAVTLPARAPAASQPTMAQGTATRPARVPTRSAQPARVPVAPTRPARKARNVVKATAEVYRYLPQDMPEDLDGLKKAMDIHIRILWGLLDSKAVPKDPPSQLLNSFAIRFTTEAQLETSQASGPELIPLSLVHIGTLMSSYSGGIARHARLVEQHMLSYIQVRLSRLGFDRWCPDLRQTPYALYNCACRIVALDTFKQALVSNTYEHLGPNLRYAQNMEVLTRLFDHFTFFYMYARYKRESRLPGSVEQELRFSPVYQARLRLADARLKFLEENGYPQRYRDLIDPKATSDDELQEGSKIWLIKRRPERSAEVEQFFRILDAKREEYARQQKSRKWRERIRVVPTIGQQDSEFKVLAEGMPIDYFDPTFFNQLQPRIRNRVGIAKVALLPNIEDSLSWTGDERLSDRAFNQRYGRNVFDRYNMVTDADVTFADVPDDEGSGTIEDSKLSNNEGDGDWIDAEEARSSDGSDEGSEVTDIIDSQGSGEGMSISSASASSSATDHGPTQGQEDPERESGPLDDGATLAPTTPRPTPGPEA